MHRCASILERRINIDRGRSIPRSSSIKGPECQGPVPVPRLPSTVPFPGSVPFPVGYRVRHHGISDCSDAWV